jgi:hypothetical protein
MRARACLRSVLQGLQGDVVQLVREMDTGVIEGEDGAGAGEPDGKVGLPFPLG